MFARGELILCGTSTTGTGTLTLAATPVPPGGVDPVAAFGTSGAFPVSYVIREYTNALFTTLHQMERGYGTLTLNASLTSVTLSRSPTVTATSLDSQPATYNNATATALTIGTAANVLVEIGPNSAEDNIESFPNGFISSPTGGDGLGISGLIGQGAASYTFANNIAYFIPIGIGQSGLIKSMSIRVQTAVTTPTTNSIQGALFEIASSGSPGKRIINFGTVSGTTGAPLGAQGNVTMTAGAAIYVPAGMYIAGLLPSWTGGSGSPAFRGGPGVVPSSFGTALSAFTGGASATVSAGNLNDPPTGTFTINTTPITHPGFVWRAT